jgi:hypothetical protein
VSCRKHRINRLLVHVMPFSSRPREMIDPPKPADQHLARPPDLLVQLALIELA